MSELDHMDALAAEYVLGTLESEERAQARTLLDADQAFAAKVQLWERRFGELHLMVEPVEPDSNIWARIKTQMPEGRQQMRPPEPPMPPAPAPAAAAAAAASEPPSLDAIEAAISEAATTLSAEANASAATPASQAPTSETVPTSVSEATATPALEAMPTSVAEATTAPLSEPTPTNLSEPAALAASEATSAPISEAPAATTPGATETSAVEAVPSPPVAPVSAGATPQPAQDLETEPVTAATGTSAVEAVPSPPVPTASALAPRPDEDLERATAVLRRRLTRWRAFAIVMTLLVAGAAVLLAAWRFAPDGVPPMLQPVEVMRHLGVTLPAGSPPRRPAPPGSQFDE